MSPSLRHFVQVAKIIAPGLSLLRGLKSLHLAHNKIGCVGCSALSDALFLDVGDHGDGVRYKLKLFMDISINIITGALTIITATG